MTIAATIVKRVKSLPVPLQKTWRDFLLKATQTHLTDQDRAELSRLGLLEILKQDVPSLRLKSKAKNEWCGASPDGTAKNDGFIVWPDKGQWWNRKTGKGGDAISYLMDFRGMTYPDAVQLLQSAYGTPATLVSSGNGNGKAAKPGTKQVGVKRSYLYTNADDTPAYRVDRLDYDDGSKSFFCSRPDGKGGWIKGLPKDVPRLLYRLPEILRQPGDPVIIVEGEGKVHCLRDKMFLGIPVTCIAGGVNGTLPGDFTEVLSGREISILPDNDKPGKGFAIRIATLLYGKAKSIKIVELPGLPEKGDIVDWRNQGGTVGELHELIAATPEWQPGMTPIGGNPPPVEAIEQPFSSIPRPARYTAAELLGADFPEPNWAIPGILPEGLSFLAGRPKIGKSWLALQIASAVSMGGMVLGQKTCIGKGLYLALEDSPRRLKLRMQKQLMAPTENLEFEFKWPPLQSGGLDKLAKEILRGVAFVVIDTASRVVGKNSQKDTDDMSALFSPLQRLALECRVSILVVDHHRKSMGFLEDAIDDLLGGTGKAAVADTVLGLYRNRAKGTTVLQIRGRDVDEQDLAIQWDAVTGIWQLLGNAEDVTRGNQEKAIIDLLTSQPEMTSRQIMDVTEQEKGNFSRTINGLVADGRVARKQQGKSYVYTLAATTNTILNHNHHNHQIGFYEENEPEL